MLSGWLRVVCQDPARLFRTSNRIIMSPSAGSIHISALLIDVSGTLHVGSEPIPGAVDAFKRLVASKIPFRLCSNTSKESTGDLVKRLQSLGFDLFEAQKTLTSQVDDITGRKSGTSLVWTSIGAVGQALNDFGYTRPYLLLSDSAKSEVLNALQSDKDSKDTNYDSVVIGLAPSLFDYEHLNTAFRILKGETHESSTRNPNEKTTTPRLIATHRARFIQSSTGLSLGPGPFVAALENAAGPIEVKIVGKPEAAFFEMVINDFGNLDKSAPTRAPLDAPPPRIAVIGDDVEADLGGGAIGLGLWRVLVRTGKYRPQAESLPGIVRPDEIHASFAAFIDNLLDGGVTERAW